MTGKELKELRLKLGVTKSELSEKTFLSAHAIDNVENGVPGRILGAAEMIEDALKEYQKQRGYHCKTKVKVSLADENAEAKKLGISYGLYMAYKETGYLETFIKTQEKYLDRDKDCNVIVSSIGSASANGSFLKSFNEDTRCTDDNNLD